jgi:hypothetical protein
MTQERWGYEAPDLGELVAWAGIIDGAEHPTPKDAVELPAAAQKLTLVIEGSKGSDVVQQIIRWMQRERLDDIVREPVVQEVYGPLWERHLRSIGIIRGEAVHDRGVVFFDVIDYDLEGYNKFIPYYLYPDSTYTVSVSTSTFRTKVSVGSNPWVKGTLKHNLATICERYGGGGHPRVGAISFEVGEFDKARAAAAEIREELKR